MCSYVTRWILVAWHLPDLAFHCDVQRFVLHGKTSPFMISHKKYKNTLDGHKNNFICIQYTIEYSRAQGADFGAEYGGNRKNSGIPPTRIF